MAVPVELGVLVGIRESLVAGSVVYGACCY